MCISIRSRAEQFMKDSVPCSQRFASSKKEGKNVGRSGASCGAVGSARARMLSACWWFLSPSRLMANAMTPPLAISGSAPRV